MTIFTSSVVISQETRNIDLSRHYVTSDQIQVFDRGLFVDINNCIVSVDAIYFDSSGGLYILPTEEKEAAKKTCPRGHPSVVWWGGCTDPFCPYYAYDMN